MQNAKLKNENGRNRLLLIIIFIFILYYIKQCINGLSFKITVCHKFGEFGHVTGCGLNEGGADDNAESVSDDDVCCIGSCFFKNTFIIKG